MEKFKEKYILLKKKTKIENNLQVSKFPLLTPKLQENLIPYNSQLTLSQKIEPQDIPTSISKSTKSKIQVIS